MTRGMLNRAFEGISFFTVGYVCAHFLQGTSQTITQTKESRPREMQIENADISNNFRNDASLGSAQHSTVSPSMSPRIFEIPPQVFEKLLSERISSDILPNNTVSDELADCLGMTSQERKLVDDALQSTLQTLKEQQRRHTKVIHADHDSTKLVIEKFASEGDQAKAKLYAKLNEGLGLERSVVFMGLARTSLRDEYLEFGQEEVSIELEGLAKKQDFVIRVKCGGFGSRYETDAASGVPDILQGILDIRTE